MTKKTALLARLALVVTSVIWGSAFVVMKNTLDDIPVFFLLAIRFSGSFLILALFLAPKLKLLNLSYIKRGLIMGSLLFGAYALQTYGLSMTTPGKNAFLTAAYCVIVPFLYWAISKKRPDRYNILAALLCVAGVGFVSLTRELSVGIGDFLTLLGAFLFAAHIVSVSLFTRDHDLFLLTILQFFFAGTWGWIAGFLFDTFPSSIPQSSLWSLVYLCVFSTALALLLQNIGQKYTPPASASIIMSLEAVFGVIFSMAFYHETLTLKLVIGFALISAAVVISETKLSFLRKRRAPVNELECE